MPSSPPETRASLILRLQNPSDVVAWEEFVRIYSPVVRRVATHQGFQATDVDDIVQEVMLSVAGSVTAWLERSDRGSFRAWLLRIARNRAYDLIHARSTRTLGKDGSEAEKAFGELAAKTDLSPVLDWEHERAVFQWAADQVRDSVAEHTWQAFWLTRVEGFTVEAAARKLGVRAGNIYFARSRVLARIRELVRQYEVKE